MKKKYPIKIGVCASCKIEKQLPYKYICTKCYDKKRKERNPRIYADKQKLWRKNHPEENKAQKRAYYYRHKKEQIEKRRLYRHTEKGRIVMLHKREKRRTQKMFLSESYTTIEWMVKLDATNGICPGCNTYVGKNKLELDHIIPISKAPAGFNYTINDIQPLCKSCNSRKGNKMVI